MNRRSHYSYQKDERESDKEHIKSHGAFLLPVSHFDRSFCVGEDASVLFSLGTLIRHRPSFVGDRVLSAAALVLSLLYVAAVRARPRDPLAVPPVPWL
jgi:hypothetical protein